MAKFYVVATPIGNLEDVTLRALRILSEVHSIACEDTRTTSILLNKYNIKKPLISFHSKSPDSRKNKIFEMLDQGKDLAIVSDAGTPTISDPGAKLIFQIREKFGQTVEILSIPGASAVTAALSISGLPASEFLFLGFLPQKKGRKKIIEEIASSKRTSVLYESPHRLLKTLISLAESLPRERKVVVIKEISKIYEEIKFGQPNEVLEFFSLNKGKIKGEFVILIGQ